MTDLEIIPAERIGPYHLKWDIETLKKHLPANYIVYDTHYKWWIEFEDYVIGIRKADNQIDTIAVTGKFRQHFKNKITCESTLGEIEEEFGSTDDCTEYFVLPDYPDMEMYFEEEDENDEDDDSWKKIKVKEIVINDPHFIWDKHFSREDYRRMERTKFECPFPKDKYVQRYK